MTSVTKPYYKENRNKFGEKKTNTSKLNENTPESNTKLNSKCKSNRKYRYTSSRICYHTFTGIRLTTQQGPSLDYHVKVYASIIVIQYTLLT